MLLSGPDTLYDIAACGKKKKVRRPSRAKQTPTEQATLRYSITEPKHFSGDSLGSCQFFLPSKPGSNSTHGNFPLP
jgi:hypothetical protein